MAETWLPPTSRLMIGSWECRLPVFEEKIHWLQFKFSSPYHTSPNKFSRNQTHPLAKGNRSLASKEEDQETSSSVVVKYLIKISETRMV